MFADNLTQGPCHAFPIAGKRLLEPQSALPFGCGRVPEDQTEHRRGCFGLSLFDNLREPVRFGLKPFIITALPRIFSASALLCRHRRFGDAPRQEDVSRGCSRFLPARDEAHDPPRCCRRFAVSGATSRRRVSRSRRSGQCNKATPHAHRKLDRACRESP